MCIRDRGREDKRLEIDLEGLREYIWEYADGTLKDYLTEDQFDKIRWIDTSAMICDPLTKAGPKGFADRMNNTMSTGVFSLEADAASQLKKMRNQKMRMERAALKQQTSEVNAPNGEPIDIGDSDN